MADVDVFVDQTDAFLQENGLADGNEDSLGYGTDDFDDVSESVVLTKPEIEKEPPTQPDPPPKTQHVSPPPKVLTPVVARSIKTPIPQKINGLDIGLALLKEVPFLSITEKLTAGKCCVLFVIPFRSLVALYSRKQEVSLRLVS